MVNLQQILSFIFISLFLFPGQGRGQNSEKADNLFEEEQVQGITLGVNFEGPIGRFFDTDRSAFSAVTHINLSPGWFFRGEAGFENLVFSAENAEERNFRYESNGSFVKAGLLYDFFSVDEVGNNDNIFVGINYGFAFQEHRSGGYTIENDYWGDFHDSESAYLMNTHWLEVSAGPRTELFKNFYMGWTVNLKVKILQDNARELQPYSVPGFGNGDNTVNVGFSYVLEYMIPWKK
ncbi:DUF6048 family protein [Marinilabilia salmonicolor]|uniref:Outer membrane protein with beta-barrel domain n=1 Tax=Marinilabilia salmonicolor TaxID=989 RepID=A0A368UNR7_9BACT|nr:DUF6048 family protein [Marinilabilia salmonicolor]RCW29825.1 hypothetical protein DFO77_12518 [Marinilabilia salmonicolor]